MTLPIDISSFHFGIEHEFAVLDKHDQFLDFSNTSFEDFAQVIEHLPITESDAQTLRTGDLGIKLKRWYIEGFERFTEMGDYLLTLPKGFEIRTPICTSLNQAVDTLIRDFSLWAKAARPYGYQATWTALNPFQSGFVPHPPLNAWELKDRSSPEEQTAHIHMITYGPDISFSHSDLNTDQTIDIAQKLTYYSPYIVPFSYTSPFHVGKLWGGYSRRTYYRTGDRPAALVFTSDSTKITPSFPTLTDTARIPAEDGRIEFKAFDCPPDLELYRSLGALLIGLALDDTLTGRLTVPDSELHKHSATHAFDAPDIHDSAAKVLAAARAALPLDWQKNLNRLDDMLAAKRTPAHSIIQKYKENRSISSAIQ
ncbi:MAG: glutamate--cysteine ligase [Coriobacteriia bacterium]|nr:glutamate--cysteine ligase [Coriobacteriia bacterium]